MTPMRRVIIVVVCLVLLIGGIFEAYRATEDLKAAQARIATAERERAAMAARASEAETQYRNAEIATKGLQEINAAAEAGLAEAKRVAEKSKASKSPDKPRRRLSPFTVIANDPRLFADYMTFARDVVDLDAGASMHHLQLTPEQREKFREMRIWSEQRVLDIYAAADTQKLDQAGVAELLRREGVERMKKEAEVLGPLENEFRVYGRDQAARDYAEQLAAASVYEGLAFPTEQIDALTSILAANSHRKTNQWLEPGSVNWSAAFPKAQAILSPRQFEILTQIQRLSDLSTKLRQMRSSEFR
jgi:hypothetical protein